MHSTVTVASGSDTATGWVAGAGLEVKLDRSWSVKGEYLRVELDDTVACRTPACGTTNFVANNKLDILRAGINFKF